MKKYDYTWTTATGQKLQIDDMTESHAKNVLKLLFRKIADYKASLKPKETTRQKLIRQINDPNHNPFQGELASEQWDREMEFYSTGYCGCQSSCYCHERFDDNYHVELMSRIEEY
tara:strand:- start:49 stop:393 length:345 start_codon:yes stop_codon:yes gene_type:complete